MRDNFNETEYLVANPDVAEAVRIGMFISGYEHYQKHGKMEGRMPNGFGRMTRTEKALYSLNSKGIGLEIGPSHNPIAAKKMGFNVHTLDHASAEVLKAKYQGHGVNLDNIEDVDFVWSGQPLPELIGQTNCYDWIIASHVIEHVPDIVSFLQQCEILLKDDGFLSLIVPDRRYCFDYFSPHSTSGNVLDAWNEKRIKPSPGQIFDHFSNAATREGNIAWGNESNLEADSLVHTMVQSKSEWIRCRSTDDYCDVHCWRFTPASFRLIISDLQVLGLVNLEIKLEFDTAGCEFYVTLGKTTENTVEPNRLTSLKLIKKENT